MKKFTLIIFLTSSLLMQAQCWLQVTSGSQSSGGGLHCLGIQSDGTLWAWGLNDQGQLGDGTTTNRNTPTQIGTDTDWIDIATGPNDTSFAIKSDGTIWGWGSNPNSIIVSGSSTTTVSTPTQVGTDTDWVKMSVGGGHILAQKQDGTLWSWGGGAVLGVGGVPSVTNIPQQITTDTWKSFAAGFSRGYGVKSDGTLWAWGDNEYGQLGDNTTVDKLTPTQIGTATNWQTIETGIYHSLALKTDGTLWFWGSRFNIYGTSTQNNIPTQIGTDTNWLKLTGGQHHCAAIKTDGTLWTWGENSTGQLGDGTTIYRTTPIQVGTATDWLDVSAGTRYTIATKNNLSLWSWGYNYSGQLGIGTSGNTSDVYIPTQVGTSLDSNKIYAGGYHALVINSDGFIRGTGSNVVGQIGDGTFVQRNTFTYISCYPSVLSNEDFIVKKIKVYPNPTNGILNFSFDKEISKVTIYNLVGQEVLSKSLNNNETSINVADLAAGAYLVKVLFGNEVKTVKVVKN